jgi:hypothetical protein
MARKQIFAIEVDPVSGDGETHVLPVYPGTILRWEKQFSGQGRSVSLFSAGMKLTYYYEVAYVAMRDSGTLPDGMDYAAFQDAYDVMEQGAVQDSPVDAVAGALDPIPTAVSSEPPSPSPSLPADLSSTGNAS